MGSDVMSPIAVSPLDFKVHVSPSACVGREWAACIRGRSSMHLVWQDEEERRELLFDRDKKLHFGLLVKKGKKKTTMNPAASSGS